MEAKKSHTIKIIKVRPGSIAWMYLKHKENFKLGFFFSTTFIIFMLVVNLCLIAYTGVHQQRYEKCLETATEIFCISRF